MITHLYIGEVDSSLYHSINDTESSSVGGVILHGMGTFPPETPKTVAIVSGKKEKFMNRVEEYFMNSLTIGNCALKGLIIIG